MKITINKKFTEAEMMERTQSQSKEFKAMYTDADLLRMFREATGCQQGYTDEIIRCNLSAFPGGAYETDETHYEVDILLEGYKSFTKIHFYISQSLEIDTRDIWMCGKARKMYEVKEYKAA